MTATEQRLVDEMTALLSGKVLKQEENQADRDYSGGGFYWEKSKALYFYDDGSYRYEEKQFSSVSGGGLSLPSEKSFARSGRWAIEIVRGEVAMVLSENDEVVWCARTRNGGQGVHYIEGERWNRYRMN